VCAFSLRISSHLDKFRAAKEAMSKCGLDRAFLRLDSNGAARSVIDSSCKLGSYGKALNSVGSYQFVF